MNETDKEAALLAVRSTVGLGGNEWLELLREAVIARRECNKAYREFVRTISGRFPTLKERTKQIALHSALTMAERAVMDAAEALTPNAKLSAGQRREEKP